MNQDQLLELDKELIEYLRSTTAYGQGTQAYHLLSRCRIAIASFVSHLDEDEQDRRERDLYT